MAVAIVAFLTSLNPIRTKWDVPEVTKPERKGHHGGTVYKQITNAILASNF